MWQKFIDLLNEQQPLTKYNAKGHQAFIGSIARYRQVFLQANPVAAPVVAEVSRGYASDEHPRYKCTCRTVTNNDQDVCMGCGLVIDYSWRSENVEGCMP